MNTFNHLRVLLVAIILLLQISSTKGAFFTPIAFTLPAGLQSVNGSSITGGCQPESCVVIPYSGTTINGCDCPGTAAVNGSLIDGVIPSIDTTQRGKWANELFVVNRNGQDSFMIGFEFSNSLLRHVEIAYLDCPVWGTSFSSVNIYSSNVYPGFLSVASANIGNLSLADDNNQDCTSLTTLSISLQPVAPTEFYYIEFFFGGSPVRAINWVHLAEIKFSDVLSTTSSPPATERTSDSMTTLPITSIATTLVSPTHDTENTSTFFTATDHEALTMQLQDTDASSHSTDTEVTGISVAAAAVPVSIIVGALVSIILVLILLIVAGVALTACFVFYNKRHIQSLEVRKLQYIVTETPTSGSIQELDSFTKQNEESKELVALNSHYRPSSPSNIGPSNSPPGSPESDLYSEIRDEGEKGRSKSAPANTSSGLYDDIQEQNYADVLELYSEAAAPTCLSQEVKQEEKRDVDPTLDNENKREATPAKKLDYTLIQKLPPPPVPEKSSDLKDYLDLKAQEEDARNQIPVHEQGRQLNEVREEEECYSEIQDTRDIRNTTNNSAQSQIPSIKVVPVGIYSQVREEMRGENDVDFYTDMRGNSSPSRPHSRSRLSSSGSGPVPLSKLTCDSMEDNPMYDTSGSLMHAFISHAHGEDIYTDPDVSFQEDSRKAIYEAVYSEASVQPSIFKQEMERRRSDLGKNMKETEQKAAFGDNSEDEEENNEKVTMYAPIYVLSETACQPKRQPLTVTNDNIRGVKLLGTGFFGKVVLAETVGLSPKDLGLSATDDSKNTSIRVAVKKLKPTASKTTQEAFEKEYKFMSRLDHPNVIRMLGGCNTGPSQFIMMEYMERGDLNKHLSIFKTIIIEGAPKEKEILVDTLIYMCTQIASAMRYLVSRNFIHRDLAARNCLVGADNLIKLADFGMSRSLYESHYYIIRGQAILPVRWMATECFYGKFSAKTDVWAFGVTMWEIFMLAKERPYSDMEDLEVVDDAIEKEQRTLLQQPQHCPDDVFEVMMRCWASDPKDRATFEELHAALYQLSIRDMDDSTEI